MHVTPVLQQSGFRGRADDVVLNSTSFTHARDTNYTRAVTTVFRERQLIQETAGGERSNVQFKLQYNHSAAPGWNDVSGTSPLQWANSGQYADQDATTQVLGSGTFVANEGSEGDNITETATTFAANEETETEWALSIDTAQVSDADTIQIRVVESDGTLLGGTYTNSTITVSKPSTKEARVTAAKATLTYSEIVGRVTAAKAALTYTPKTARVTATKTQLTYSEIAARVTATKTQLTYSEIAARVTATKAQLTYSEIVGRVTAAKAQLTYTPKTARVTAVKAQLTYSEIAARVTATKTQLTYSEIAARVTAAKAQLTYTIIISLIEMDHPIDLTPTRTVPTVGLTITRDVTIVTIIATVPTVGLVITFDAPIEMEFSREQPPPPQKGPLPGEE
jgi:hypothetical protein